MGATTGSAQSTRTRVLVGLKVEPAFNATVADLALPYSFAAREAALGKAGKFSVIPYAGVRNVDANVGVSTTINVLRFERQFSLEQSHTWVQARWR